MNDNELRVLSQKINFTIFLTCVCLVAIVIIGFHEFSEPRKVICEIKPIKTEKINAEVKKPAPYPVKARENTENNVDGRVPPWEDGKPKQ